MRVFRQIIIWLGIIFVYVMSLIKLQGTLEAGVLLVIALILFEIYGLYHDEVEELKTEIRRLESRLEDIEDKTHDE